MEEFGDWFAVGAGVFCAFLGAYYLLKYWTVRQRAAGTAVGGEQVTVRYDPKNPEEAESEGTGWSQPFLLLFLVVFGVVLVVLGVG